MSDSPLSEVALQLCKKRYFQKDEQGNPIEDWKGLVTRVINHVCSEESEEYKQEISDLIYQTKFLPNTPCLVNAGRDGKASGLSACYVTTSPGDSWKGIVQNIKNFGDVARVGGGCGVSFSKIRPEGDPVFGSSHAKACGPIEAMRMVSEAMSSITQSGIRGMANMATLHVSHPDIINFIKCKQRERALKTYLKEDIFSHFDQLNGKTDKQLNIVLDKFISNFNISVVVNNAFMEAVEGDANWDLTFGGKVYRTIKAREIFDLITENAWKNGDPGLLFEDEVNNGPYKYSKQWIDATNPCVTGDTLVATEHGWRPVAEIRKGDRIWTQNELHPVTSIEINHDMRVSRVVFSDGNHVDATDSHQFKCAYGSTHRYTRLDNLQIGSVIFTERPDNRAKQPYPTVSVVNITALDGLHTVYDLYVHATDEWNTNGVISRGCGEQPLPSNGVCNLGSIDVSKFYKESFSWKSFARAIHLAVQFLDDVVSKNVFPNDEFAAWAQDNRPIGLGIMGLADLFLKMEIAYGSQESLNMAEKLAEFMETEAHKKSVELAKERGTPKCCKFDELEHRRNVTLTSIAPTGSISMIAGCSSSIEPIFSPTIYRYDNTGSYVIAHPDSKKSYFRCAVDKDQNGKREVHWKEHILMQAAFQKYGSSGISKTCNFPNSATLDDVKQAYLLAWKTKCKGITVYRDGCKTTQVLTTDGKEKFDTSPFMPRPKEIPCDIFKAKADGFEWHVIVGKLNDKPYELFAVNGRVELPDNGTVVKIKKRHYALLNDAGETLIDNLAEEEDRISPKISLETRRFSLELRHNIPPKFIVEQIDKSTEVVTSFSKAVGRIMKKKYLSNQDCATIAEDVACPQCAKQGKMSEMIFEAGCSKCPTCSYSKCG